MWICLPPLLRLEGLHLPMAVTGLTAIYGVQAPAKLNLFLHITGQRPDGYHLLQSVFMLIDWCDLLHFERRLDGQLSRSDIGSGERQQLPADDLCMRAARALQTATGTSLGVHITLEKHIPTQAGLGGGSSDAAACLLALQRLWGIRLPDAQLQALALSLGADVPFFLAGSHAWVEGIGEKITPMVLPAAEFLVLKPAAGVSTPAIFSAPALTRNNPVIHPSKLTALASAKEMAAFGRNDLQPVAVQLCPEIGQALAWLSAQGLEGRMSGSGSAVFAWLPPTNAASQSAQSTSFLDLPDGWIARRCKNLPVHPLLDW